MMTGEKRESLLESQEPFRPEIKHEIDRGLPSLCDELRSLLRE